MVRHDGKTKHRSCHKKLGNAFAVKSYAKLRAGTRCLGSTPLTWVGQVLGRLRAVGQGRRLAGRADGAAAQVGGSGRLALLQ